ncbi:MAG: putative peptidoglycan lipid flippase [Actinomycetota bacterium]|nr:putative peptidoglycan lipid flippase [Actinomycetota bacterium]
MRSSGLMAAGTMVSRVLGQVRSTALGWAIGGLASANVFATANTLPNNFYALLAGGVLNAVLVPQVVKATKQEDGGQQFVDRLLTISGALILAATLAVTALAGPLFLLYSTDLPADQIALGTAFALWCLPQIFFYGLYTLLGQVLNARGSFGPYMWAPVVNNIVAIAGLLLFVVVAGPGRKEVGWWNPATIALLGGTATLGVAMQAVVLIPVLRRSGFRWRPRWGIRGLGLESAGKVAGWTFAAVFIGQLGFIVTTRVTNYGGLMAERAHAEIQAGRWAFDQAYLLFMLPHSLVTVSLVTAFFTRMSHAAVSDRTDLIVADLSLGLRTTGVATVFATAAFCVLSPQIAAIAYLGNTDTETHGIAMVTISMALGLVPYSAQYLLQRVFYAYEDAKGPFAIQLVMALVWAAGNVAAAVTLPAEWITVGVGASLSASNVAGALLSLRSLRKKLGPLDMGLVARSHLKFLLAGSGAALAGLGCRWMLQGQVGSGLVSAMVILSISGTVMLVVYAGLLQLFDTRELESLTNVVASKLGRSAKGAGRHVNP